MVKDFKGTTAIVIGLVVGLAILIALVAGVRTSHLDRGDSGLSNEYRLDLKDLARVDPQLLLFEPVGDPVPTGLRHARAMVVDAQGAWHVVGDQVIKVYEQGTEVRHLDVSFAPRSLALTSDRYYVAATDRVVEMDFEGQTLETWPTLGESALITALAVDDEHVFIADAGQRVVWCYDRAGNLLRRIGDRDPERRIPGFMIPSPYFDLALAPGGRLCVTNPGRHRIETYTADGDLETWWGEFGTSIEGFTGCCNPCSFTILPDGRFVTCEKGLVRVKVYKADGAFAGVVAGADQLTEGTVAICELPEQCQTGGFDVAADRDGRVYVLDTVRNLIRIYVEKEG
jgi:hypothetical protein